jgi:hypothetical protein
MIFILFSILLFSFNNVLWKKNIQNISISFLIAYRAFFTSLISLVAMFYYYDFITVTNFPILRITIGSLFGVLGLFCMLTVIKKAPLQWLGIYNLVGILFTAIYLRFFEKIEIIDSILGSIIIVLGFLFYIFKNREPNVKLEIKQHLYLILMTFNFGISSLVHWKNLDANIPAIYIVSNQELIVFFVAGSVGMKNWKKEEMYLNLKSNFKKVLFMAFIIFLALLSSLMGLEVTNPFVSSLLFLASPILTILFGSIYFKENLSLNSVISIIVIAFGAFIIHNKNIDFLM